MRPCVYGLSRLRNTYDRLCEHFVFVSAWNDPDLKTFRYNHFGKKQVIVWPSLWDRYGILASAFGIEVYPTYVLIDPRGNEIKRWPGRFPDVLKRYAAGQAE